MTTISVGRPVTRFEGPDQIFRTDLGRTIFRQRYMHERCETWPDLARTLAHQVCGELCDSDTVKAIEQIIAKMWFIPGGRYLYYAARPRKFFSNCLLFRSEEDTREDWAHLNFKATSALMSGAGIGNDYSIYRASGSLLASTGGTASGPLPAMHMVNSIGHQVMQGGSRRSAIYASLNYLHGDAFDFLRAKDWDNMPIAGTGATYGDAKRADFNFRCPLDFTNISLNYDDSWLTSRQPGSNLDFAELPFIGKWDDPTFLANCESACRTGEPGFSFNFFDKQNETLRNAPLSGDTYVRTMHGHEKILNLLGRTVRVWTGKQWASTRFVRTAEMVPTLSVRMSGGRCIDAEPSHPFLVERYQGVGDKRTLAAIERVPASDLKEGDILHVSLTDQAPHPDFCEQSYVLGFGYGDGSFSRYGLDITFCSEEKKKIAHEIDWSTLDATVNWNDARGFVRAQIKNLAPTNANKYECSTTGSFDNSAFLAGLFDADGNYDETTAAIRLSSNHRSFLCDVRRLLEQEGILSLVSKNGGTGNGSFSDNPSYQLVIARDNNNRFRDRIPTRRIKPAEHTAYRASRIKVLSVEDGPVQDVYCCNVGVEEHSFEAEGVIVSNCCEVTSENDSDICNLGSLNMSRIPSLEDFRETARLATIFLMCGNIVGEAPTEKATRTRAKNQRTGLGLMGVHEWLLKRGYTYECVPELRQWLTEYEKQSDSAADEYAMKFSLPRPKGVRAIAPTGTIGMLAGTTTGIEPVIYTAYRRQYMKGDTYHHEYVIDPTVEALTQECGINPDEIETSYDLAVDFERRLEFQADVQEFVDHAISSTINLPKWGSPENNPDTVPRFARSLASYAPRLRGFTVYPDAARGGQPITQVPYAEALAHQHAEVGADICSISGKGGTCGE